MSVHTEYCGDLTVFKIDGDLAGINADELRALATESLNDGRRDFAVELSGAKTCDSAGLEALTWLHRECTSRLGLVKLCEVSDTIEKILEITRLNHLFQDLEDTY